MMHREISDIKKVIVHCSDSPNDLDIGVGEIRKWHIERGFDDIGYHFVIRRSGSIEQGRPVLFVGSHVKGHNFDSVGICLIGKDSFTQAQARSLFYLYLNFFKYYKIDHTSWHCHNDFDKNKTCPNFNRDSLLNFISFSMRYKDFKGDENLDYMKEIRWVH